MNATHRSRRPLLSRLRTARGERGELTQRLAEAERLLTVVLRSGTELPWRADADGTLLWAGELCREYFGYSPDEVPGLNLAAVVHPAELPRLRRLIRSGRGWEHERFRCVRKDGSERWFEGSALVHHGPGGRIAGLTGSAHPIDDGDRRLSAAAEDTYALLGGDALRTVFQPILSLETGRLVGAEALSRVDGSDRGIEQWFADAAEVGLTIELELHAVRRALGAAGRLPPDIYVSFNVSPATVQCPSLLSTLLGSALPMRRVVLEITEHASVPDYAELAAAVGRLRAAGARIAIDDAGAGYASFRHILRLAPEVIKLDRSLVQDLHADRARRAFAAAIVMFALETRATVVAEGVETVAELRAAQTLGIDAAQGYLFGRPTGDWSTWLDWHRRGPLLRVSGGGAAGTG